MKTTIYLPNFPWFYESALSSIVDREEEYLLDELINDGKLPPESDYDDMTKIIYIDYTKTHGYIAESYFDSFKSELTNNPTGITIWEYESMYSPKQYNFSSDEINMSVEYDPDTITKYLDDNREAFTAYIKTENTSYDGFRSFMTNDYDAYIRTLRDDTHESQLTQVLEFYIENNMPELRDNIVEELYSESYLEYEYITK